MRWAGLEEEYDGNKGRESGCASDMPCRWRRGVKVVGKVAMSELLTNSGAPRTTIAIMVQA